MPYADVNDVRLFYTDEGDGPFTLLFMHGLSADSHDWNWIIPILRSKYRLLACDLRGHGHSSIPDSYAMGDFVADMVALVDHVDCGPVVPVGHSLGGAIAASIAVEHPSLVRAVVEVDPAYALPDWLVAMWEQGRAAWRAGNIELAAQGAGLAGMPVTPDFLTTWNARRAEAAPVDALWKAYEGLADGPEQMFAHTPAADEYLKRRECPVLSIHSLPGRASWETPLFQHPASHALEWEGSGHSLHVERPREFAFVMTNWLNALPGARTAQPAADIDSRAGL